MSRFRKVNLQKFRHGTLASMMRCPSTYPAVGLAVGARQGALGEILGAEILAYRNLERTQFGFHMTPAVSRPKMCILPVAIFATSATEPSLVASTAASSSAV